MYIEFSQLPPSARIWIYQSNRFLSAEEVTKIKSEAINFVEQWTAHQQTLKAGFEILHNLFLILAVDENHNDASGCSIDKSVHFMQHIAKEYNLDLFNRLNVVYRNNGKLNLIHFSKLLTDIKNNDPAQIFIFNNLISSKNQMQTEWEIPLEKSWLSKRTV